MEKIINYFAVGNTAKGIISFYESIFQDVKKFYVLKGSSNTYKTKVLKDISNYYCDLYDVDIINSTLDIFEVEAIKIEKLGLAFVNGELIHGKDIIMDSSKDKVCIIDLNDSLDKVELDKNKDKLDNLKISVIKNLNSACEEYAKAFEIHQKIEEFYFRNMDFSKANTLTNELANKLINKKKDKLGKIYHRYLGGATPKGSIDFIMNITLGLKKYFIKGRSGTGKSTMLKVIAKKAYENGLNVEMYHCGFDPDSIDMIVIRELSFAIFDSTAPHEYFPSSVSDEVIDSYKEFCTADVDNIYKNELENLNKESAKIKKVALDYLNKAINFKNEHDKIYDSLQDYEIADKIISSNI